jgi:hypothetical protein
MNVQEKRAAFGELDVLQSVPKGDVKKGVALLRSAYDVWWHPPRNLAPGYCHPANRAVRPVQD